MTLIRSMAVLALAGSFGVASAQESRFSEDELAIIRPLYNLQQDVRQRLEEEKPEEAHRRVEEEIKEIEAARMADPDAWLPAARLVWTLKEQIDVTLQTREPREAAEICEAILARQRELAQTFPDEILLIAPHLTSHDIAIRKLINRDTDRAERFLPLYRTAIDSIPTDDARWKEMAEEHEGFYTFRRGDLARILHQRALIGEPVPALPLVGDWVNGLPLTEDDLKGKVVLLDFWAVYCGPCIAAFPELRRWHEEYADRGLVIVGVTGCFGYDWDDEKQQVVKDDDISRSDELRALERFAAHHGLSYRFLSEHEDYPLISAYKVNSIPQSVLIDRQGKVRLIEAGSGEDAIRNLEAAIAELIDTP